MTIKTIDPQSILEAYVKTQLQPTSRRWVHVDTEGNKYACALSTLACASGIEFNNIQSVEDEEIGACYEYMRCKLELDYEYMLGFIGAFDGNTDLPYYIDGRQQRDHYLKGIEDGKATRELINEYFIVSDFLLRED